MLFIKGLIIGIGKILPGVSGTALAVSLNEYQNIIFSLNHISKASKYLCKIFAGILLSMIIISKFMIHFLNVNYNITMSFFIGLMLGCLPDIYCKTDKRNYYWSILGILVLFIISTIKISININDSIKFLIIGIIESVTTIIPGISGTAILTNLSLYSDYLQKWSEILEIKLLVQNIGFYVPFMIGFLLTTWLSIKIIGKTINKYPNIFNSLTFGFMIESLLILIKEIDFQQNLPLILITIFAGSIIGYQLNAKLNT